MSRSDNYQIADVLKNIGNPDADHSNISHLLVIFNIVAISLTCLIVFSRTLVRALIVKHVALEDYLMVVAGLAAVSLSTMVIIGKYAHPSLQFLC
jgi:hypothetical protein